MLANQPGLDDGALVNFRDAVEPWNDCPVQRFAHVGEVWRICPSSRGEHVGSRADDRKGLAKATRDGKIRLVLNQGVQFDRRKLASGRHVLPIQPRPNAAGH